MADGEYAEHKKGSRENNNSPKLREDTGKNGIMECRTRIPAALEQKNDYQQNHTAQTLTGTLDMGAKAAEGAKPSLTSNNPTSTSLTGVSREGADLTIKTEELKPTWPKRL